MPIIGEMVNLKVTKIVKSGAFLSNPKEPGVNFFLHIKEATNEKWLDSLESITSEGEIIATRVIGSKEYNKKITYQVSLKHTDDEEYKSKQFKEKMDSFMKQSGEVQSQIKKNARRKFDGRKPKKNTTK